jgi:hypothetical protein
MSAPSLVIYSCGVSYFHSDNCKCEITVGMSQHVVCKGLWEMDNHQWDVSLLWNALSFKSLRHK